MKSLFVFFILIFASSECLANPSLLMRRVYSLIPTVSALSLKRISRTSSLSSQIRLMHASRKPITGSAWNAVLSNAQYSQPNLGFLGNPSADLAFTSESVYPFIPQDIAQLLQISSSESDFVYKLIKAHHTLDVEQESCQFSDLSKWIESSGPYALKVKVDEQIVISDEYDEALHDLKTMETHLDKHSFVIEKTASDKFHFYQAVKGEITLLEFMTNAELNSRCSEI
ncbi:MAG: hypothetical protein HRU09_17250 [Oligoflexales bacterium]|nr:hypothetical protein [Oligoflexales bacterium]